MKRVLVLGILLSLCACNNPSPRLNAPPHGQPTETVDSQGTFVYMADNALLADMSMSDMHFLPHRAGLTTLGEQRLGRMASLMEAYGGTIRFSTNLEDKELVDARTRTIVDFLRECGVSVTSETVTQDAPGGDGMAAAEAILIRAHEGTYQAKKSSGQADASDASGTDKDKP